MMLIFWLHRLPKSAILAEAGLSCNRSPLNFVEFILSFEKKKCPKQGKMSWLASGSFSFKKKTSLASLTSTQSFLKQSLGWKQPDYSKHLIFSSKRIAPPFSRPSCGIKRTKLPELCHFHRRCSRSPANCIFNPHNSVNSSSLISARTFVGGSFVPVHVNIEKK